MLNSIIKIFKVYDALQKPLKTRFVMNNSVINCCFLIDLSLESCLFQKEYVVVSEYFLKLYKLLGLLSF